MLTCHREGCYGANCGSPGPKYKQLKHYVPHGDEEGQQRDVVEPTGEQTEMGRKVQFIQCRGSGQTWNTQIKIQEMIMAKEKGDLVLWKTWSLDPINFIHV